MSIVRIGLAETKKFSDGYEAIFGKQKAETTSAEPKSKKKAAPAKAKKKTPKKK